MVNPSQTQTKSGNQEQRNNSQNQGQSGKSNDASSSRIGTNIEKDEPKAKVQDRNQSGRSASDNQKQSNTK